MNKTMLRMLGAMAAAVFLATGCATFPQDGVPHVDKLPDKSAYAHKPSVFFDATMVVDMSGGKNPPAANKPGTDKFKEIVAKVANESAMFSASTMDPFKGRDMDYTVKLELANRGDSGSAAVSGFITGFTLFIIPGKATDEYRLTANVTDRSGRKLGSYQLNDSVDTWLGIWFIPFAAKSPATVVPQVWENMFKKILENISNDKLMQYSWAPLSRVRVALVDGVY
jgi:hypothetical protein